MAPTVHEIIQAARQLTEEDRQRLVQALTAGQTDSGRRITELRGLGKEIWHDQDTQQYVDQERDSWAGLTSVITGKALAFDTSPLIYYIGQHPKYLQATDDLFNAIDSGDAKGMTSVLTLLEVLVQPIRSGRLDLANEYRQLLQRSRGISLFPLLGDTCEVSARLRAKYEWL